MWIFITMATLKFASTEIMCIFKMTRDNEFRVSIYLAKSIVDGNNSTI